MVKDWKKIRDKWLKYMVKFSELGDKEKANACLDQAVRANQLRTEIESIKVPYGYKFIK